MYNTTHYATLMIRLSNEKGYLTLATKQSEIELRTVWIKQIEKEIESEAEFLKSKGVDVYHSVVDNNLTEDDLLNELFVEVHVTLQTTRHYTTNHQRPCVVGLCRKSFPIRIILDVW